jgi:hypothetical protein
MSVQGGGVDAEVRGLSSDRRGGVAAGRHGVPVPPQIAVPHDNRAGTGRFSLHDTQSGAGSAIKDGEGLLMNQSRLRSPISLRDKGSIPFDPGTQFDIPTGQQRGCSVFGVGTRLVDSDAVLQTTDTMNLICWNCRGVGRTLGSNKMQYLANLMTSTNAKVTFISETLSSKINSHDLVNRFPISDCFVVPAEGRAGGLWVMWLDDIKLDIIHSSQNVILASVVNTSTNFSFLLVCVYGDPHHRKNKDIWKLIEEFVSSSPGKPVYCMGDFNDILDPLEKNSTVVSNHRCLASFANYVKRCGLIDMGYNGPAYTWCNK